MLYSLFLNLITIRRRNMLLSIVMMVKNEERYLDKTLYALNDLRKDIDT